MRQASPQQKTAARARARPPWNPRVGRRRTPRKGRCPRGLWRPKVSAIEGFVWRRAGRDASGRFLFGRVRGESCRGVVRLHAGGYDAADILRGPSMHRTMAWLSLAAMACGGRTTAADSEYSGLVSATMTVVNQTGTASLTAGFERATSPA